MSVNVATTIGAVIQGIKLLLDYGEIQKKQKKETLDSIGKVMQACVKTKAYLHDVRTLGVAANREKELSIAEAWQGAANAIYNVDQKLFESTQVKALSWADPKEWHSKRAEGVVVKLDLLIEQCEWLKAQLEK
ncbi:hypothetical protein HQQ92_04090 [Shewanella sp. DC2-4]|uniref:hypothetical protein n=1 Tax=Shewanella sp. DC2-4 TaxID=2739431 RepID=UPI001564EEA4|nr:hypothetical protein [Shewanella sp. DC2-4]NRD30992.1 hypothetical protein [Shewanella sp. DC2-4]